MEDTCDAIDRVICANPDQVVGEAFNIGTSESLSVAAIAKLVAARMGAGPEMITSIGERPGQVFRHTADAAKARQVLGWVPTRTFSQGLDEVVAWYQAHRGFWEKQLWLRDVPVLTTRGPERH